MIRAFRGPILSGIVAGAIMLLVTWQPRGHMYRNGWNDFLSYYAGGRLAFTDKLYDPATVSRVQLESAGDTWKAQRFVRLPHYAVALSPLAALPYLPAYVLWQVLNLAAVVMAVWLWPYSRVVFAYTLAFWVPLYIALLNAQDLALTLCALTATARALRSGNDRLAGMALAACLIKYHLFVLAPLALWRRPRVVLLAGGLTAAALGAVTFLNPSWPRQYWETVLQGRSVISFTPVNLFPHAGWFALPVAAGAALFVARRRPPEIALLCSVPLAVLTVPHAFFQDYTLAAPVTALVFEWDRRRARTRGTASHG